jgi:hypothetical protein
MEDIPPIALEIVSGKRDRAVRAIFTALESPFF